MTKKTLLIILFATLSLNISAMVRMKYNPEGSSKIEIVLENEDVFQTSLAKLYDDSLVKDFNIIAENFREEVTIELDLLSYIKGMSSSLNNLFFLSALTTNKNPKPLRFKVYQDGVELKMVGNSKPIIHPRNAYVDAHGVYYYSSNLMFSADEKFNALD